MKLLKEQLWDDPIKDAVARVSGQQIKGQIYRQVRSQVSDPVSRTVHTQVNGQVITQVSWQVDRVIGELE